MVDQSRGSITDVGGLLVGHAQDFDALTGCTVLLCEQPAVVGVSVRGSAPATRETDLCRPGTLVEHANAIFLSGGSAFGLSAAGGVMSWLYERDIGHQTSVAKVPIVPGACIFDLAIGQAGWPDEEMAYEACSQASSHVAEGCVGAGTGATVGKILGLEQAMKSGLGTASMSLDGVIVGALFVVNALGDVVDPETGRIVAGTRDPATGGLVGSVELLQSGIVPPRPPTANTTIGVVATDAVLDSVQTNRLADIAHDAIARTVQPAHTIYDGDAIFALSTGASNVKVPMVALEVAVVRSVERAIVRAVEAAVSLGGLPAVRNL